MAWPFFWGATGAVGDCSTRASLLAQARIQDAHTEANARHACVSPPSRPIELNAAPRTPACMRRATSKGTTASWRACQIRTGHRTRDKSAVPGGDDEASSATLSTRSGYSIAARRAMLPPRDHPTSRVSSLSPRVRSWLAERGACDPSRPSTTCKMSLQRSKVTFSAPRTRTGTSPTSAFQRHVTRSFLPEREDT